MSRKKWSRWEITLLATPFIILGALPLARSLEQSEILRPAIELFQQSEKARRSGCQNWQRQIGLASLQYAADSDSRFPVVISKQPKIAGWADALQPWIKCTSCYHCPDDKVLFNANQWGRVTHLSGSTITCQEFARTQCAFLPQRSW